MNAGYSKPSVSVVSVSVNAERQTDLFEHFLLPLFKVPIQNIAKGLGNDNVAMILEMGMPARETVIGSFVAVRESLKDKEDNVEIFCAVDYLTRGVAEIEGDKEAVQKHFRLAFRSAEEASKSQCKILHRLLATRICIAAGWICHGEVLGDANHAQELAVLSLRALYDHKDIADLLRREIGMYTAQGMTTKVLNPIETAKNLISRTWETLAAVNDIYDLAVLSKSWFQEHKVPLPSGDDALKILVIHPKSEPHKDPTPEDTIVDPLVDLKIFQMQRYLQKIVARTGNVLSIALLGENAIALGTDDWQTELWDGRKREYHGTLEGHKDEITSLAFGNDLLASGSKDHSVVIWENVADDRYEWKNAGTLNGHSDTVSSLAFGPFKMGGGLLASGSHDRTVVLWDVGKRESVGTLKETGGVLTLAWGQGVVAVGGWGGKFPVKLWDISTQQNVGTLNGHRDSVNAVAFAGEGLLISGSSDKTIKLWDMRTNDCVGTFTGSSDWVQTVAFMEDFLVSGSKDGQVRLWDFKTQRLIRKTMVNHSKAVTAVAFADGLLVSGSKDGTACVWDTSG
eukprot:gnl/MRDRNA2_/MRDRNA2_27299_c0_seq1.p1 gnl/MRDRNA2_/MRDRNA2_27299_c0~~gnl/MRDRNA2_/MRDRNA2_27299_c0_seq1.p1  ORF type:complete len:568 (+),score=109.64 gnl/MRDRNA2_/MRDRNA2_27299_c0_seq1:63-1766(+)